MNLRSVSIIFYQGKFYIPSSQESVSGIIIDAEPVYVIDAEISELVKVIENVLLTPRPQVPDLTRDEWKKRKDPVLIATGAKSWKELARKGASYNIGWSDKQKRLDIARVDKQGKWEFDPEKAQTFPVTTPLETIAKIILDDIGSMIVVISEFSLGAPIIRLSVNAMKWCQVSLLVENRNIYLGAERIDYVIKHLLEGFSDQEKNHLV